MADKVRDMKLAKDAFLSGDVELSIKAHNVKYTKTSGLDDNQTLIQANANMSDNILEDHSAASEYVKSLVFGGLDGIITTFAIVAAVQGANLPSRVVLLIGFSNLFADAVSMGLGDYISENAEINLTKHERSREAWEMEINPDAERSEMIEIYVSKGVSVEDATTIITTMSKYKEFFIDHMMVAELGLMPVDEDDSTAAKKGFVTFMAFIIFGCVPLVIYVAFRPLDFGNKHATTAFAVSIVGTLLTIFMLGMAQGRITRQSMLMSGLLMLLNGGIAAGVSYLVGMAMDAIISN